MFGQMGRRCYFQAALCAPEPGMQLVSPRHHPHLQVPQGTHRPTPLTTRLPPPSASQGPGKAGLGKGWASPAQLTPSRPSWPPAPRQAQEGARFRKRHCESPQDQQAEGTPLPPHGSIPQASVCQPLGTNTGHRAAQRWRSHRKIQPCEQHRVNTLPWRIPHVTGCPGGRRRGWQTEHGAGFRGTGSPPGTHLCSSFRDTVTRRPWPRT